MQTTLRGLALNFGRRRTACLYPSLILFVLVGLMALWPRFVAADTLSASSWQALETQDQYKSANDETENDSNGDVGLPAEHFQTGCFLNRSNSAGPILACSLGACITRRARAPPLPALA